MAFMVLLGMMGMGISLIPMPAEMRVGSGVLKLNEHAEVTFGAGCEWEAASLARDLHARSAQTAERQTGGIDLRLNPSLSDLGEEGYKLEVRGQGIFIEAKTAAGAFYATQTVRQLLRDSREVPWMEIMDKPRFVWRGMHLDCSRHFFTVEEIKKYLDYLAAYKFNVFHWHLIDEGGWRMEVRKYPRLTEIGAWRTAHEGEIWNYANLEFPGKVSGKRVYGGFYSQAQIRDIVRYAALRHITIVPEIEMPGHCLPALVAYPEVTCSVEKRAERPYRTTAYCAGKEKTFEFLEGVLDEVMELFPSKVIHIGGDEVDQFYWANCPDCQKRMQAEGLKDTHELQSYFIRRIEKYLNDHGRMLMGWDEILEGGLAPNAMVMSWRGIEGGIAAAKAGHQVVMSPTSHCYFDYGYDGTSTEHVYGYEPVPAALSSEEARFVLGAQANVWTEWMPNFARVQTMIFPRMLAMAELLWTPAQNRDWPDFSQRLNGFYKLFSDEGISFYVQPPTTEAGLMVFQDACDVTFAGVNLPGIELRYTTDGTVPNGASPVYTGPIHIEKECVVTAGYLQAGKLLTKPVSVVCKRGVSNFQTAKGIAFDVYQRRFDKIPDFDSLTPNSSGTTDRFSIEGFESQPAVAFRWRGVINIPRDGVYRFILGSDDGSRLTLAGAVVVDNDFLQAYTERTGSAFLLKGQYPFEIGYFDAGGARGFGAFVTGPGMERTRLENLIARE